jgi:hypothetical protein
MRRRFTVYLDRMTIPFAGAVAVALALTLLSGTWSLSAAQALDPAAEQALAAVLRMLSDPALRSGAIAGNPQAGAADAQIQSLTHGSPELTRQVYELAAQIFEDLTRGTGGDAPAMSQALSRAQSDPAGLAALLSARTVERLRALATTISDQPAAK